MALDVMVTQGWVSSSAHQKLSFSRTKEIRRGARKSKGGRREGGRERERDVRECRGEG